MVCAIRLKGRALQIGNVKIYTLLLITAAMMVLCANLLPVVYENTLALSVKSSIAQYSRHVNFAAAVVIIFFVSGVYFSVSSSIGRYFYKRAAGKRVLPGDLFYYFFGKSFFLNFAFKIKLAAVKISLFLLCLLPFTISLTVLYLLLTKGVAADVCKVFAVSCLAFAVSGISFYTALSFSLFLCPYYFYSGKQMSFVEMLEESQKAMERRKVLIGRIKGSFIGWFALCVFILPVGYVWSYYKQTQAVAAHSFINS